MRSCSYQLVVTLAAAMACSRSVFAQRAQPSAEPLTLKEAESRAIHDHPEIRAGQFATLAAGEEVRQVKSAYYPTVVGSITGAQSPDGTRIAAGALNNPIIIGRLALGFAASQLLTDFGRTSDLGSSASLRVSSQEQDVAVRRATVLLLVDRAYFDALRAQAVLRVAEQTVTARQLVADQASALAAAGLKSTLDVSFARVNVSEAQLLLIEARNDVRASYAQLAATLGAPQTAAYELTDEPLPEPPPADAGSLIAQALRDRPDISRERLAVQAQIKLVDAERAAWFPTLSLVGVAGASPAHEPGIPNGYSAIGINLNVPMTNGHLYSARRAEANYRASAMQQNLRDLENLVARDVQVAWLSAQTAFERLDLTNQLLQQATDALDLAAQRYGLGLSSIVELTQAQLNQTRAQIEQATARYEFQSRTAALRYQTGSLR